ncbi:MAG: DUF2807 domain-containing protein [Bacteroidales bacterium]|jgi:hypothetical protein|nr:DUF2807 domain-containing protein [Bacteroidales bacterium]
MNLFKKGINVFLILSALVPAVSCCWIPSVVDGNKIIVDNEMDISDYQEIRLSVAGKLTYRQEAGKSPYLKISADENILPLLEVGVKGNRLSIGTKDRISVRLSQMTVETNSTNLVGIDVAGSGKVHLAGEVKTGNMDMNIAGSGSITTDGLHCETTRLDIAGSGKIQLNGSCRKVSGTISGSGDIEAFDYYVENWNCHIAGSGNMNIRASEELKINIAGSGKIRYMGNPKISSNIAGSGSIKQLP